MVDVVDVDVKRSIRQVYWVLARVDVRHDLNERAEVAARRRGRWRSLNTVVRGRDVIPPDGKDGRTIVTYAVDKGERRGESISRRRAGYGMNPMIPDERVENSLVSSDGDKG